jgi:Fe-S oxidoreductase
MEFMHQYYKENGVPLRSRLIANFSTLSKVASYVPWAYNFIFDTPFLRRIANTVVGFHPDRTMPHLAKKTFMKSYEQRAMSNEHLAMNDSKIHRSSLIAHNSKAVYLFVDEFTNYNDVEIGIKAVKLLNRLGYEVIVPNHVESGRPQLSKGLLDDAKKLANQNVSMLKDLISAETPLVGIEPSAILTFRDEYPDLVDENLAKDALKLGENVFMIEEFLAKEIEAKRISKSAFTTEKKLVKLHGHCQQKALTNIVNAKKTLSFPENYEVQLIPSGCCGMAGSFGYEKEHFELSNQIGELVLFPTIRQQAEDVIIAASGTSCRHQIHDGTGRTAKHAVEILFEALL